MYSTQYPTPPPGYMPYDFHIRTPPVSPSPGPHGPYYSPRYPVHQGTPSPRGSPKIHSRRASTQEHSFHAYASPRMPSSYFAAGYSSPRYASPLHTTSRERERERERGNDFVSPRSAFYRTKSRRYGEPDCMRTSFRRRSDSKRQSYAQYIRTVVVDDDYGHDYHDAPPPYSPYDKYQSFWDTDHHAFHDQVPIYTEAEPTVQRSKARRASHSSNNRPPPPPKRPSTTIPKSPPKATEEDARKAGIPAGFSIKNWDPTEEPIVLLGSVFDANSLGKWIYDWTVFHYGPATPMSEVAGELWLLLIQLAGKIKRAEEVMPRIRRQENREMIEDFLESGERLWVRFAKLLKHCEDYMWDAAKKETGQGKPVTMGKNSGCEFVDSIFGRDRELEKTEKLMTGVRLWSMRFDANCEDILRYPSA